MNAGTNQAFLSGKKKLNNSFVVSYSMCFDSACGLWEIYNKDYQDTRLLNLYRFSLIKSYWFNFGKLPDGKIRFLLTEWTYQF